MVIALVILAVVALYATAAGAAFSSRVIDEAGRPRRRELP